MKDIKNIKERLNQLNFNKLLILEDCKSIDSYSFDDYEKNGTGHEIEGFCTRCELANVNKSIKEKSDFQLKNISHGSHTLDFVEALENPPDMTGWKEEGIIFLMEAPSKDYGIYETREYKGITKRPAKDWYWIHDRQDIHGFPQHFKGRKYGKLITSIILTFKLKNAYLTNLVKCGMNNEDGSKFEGIGGFNKRAIDLCFQEFLLEEIEIMSPELIFTFGNSTFDNLKELLEGTDYEYLMDNVISLPHPAGIRKNVHYQVIYFIFILKGLANKNIINASESHDLIDLYIDKGYLKDE